MTEETEQEVQENALLKFARRISATPTTLSTTSAGLHGIGVGVGSRASPALTDKRWGCRYTHHNSYAG